MASAAPARIKPEITVEAKSRPELMALALVCADGLALGAAVLGGFWLWTFINPAIPSLHASMGLVVVFALIAFGLQGLYPGIGMTAVEQIRRLVLNVTYVHLLVWISMSTVRDWWWHLSRGAFLFTWLLSILLVPLMRWLCGITLAFKPWWGVPVVVLGAGRTAQTVIEKLRMNEVLGYRPVACFDDDRRKHGWCAGVPVIGVLEDAEPLAKAYGISHAVVAMPGIDRARLISLLRGWGLVFPHVILVPDLFGIASLWTETRDLGGVLGLEVQHKLLNPTNRWLKRSLDLLVGTTALLLAAPVILIAAIWIKLVSPGPAFYWQEREGRDGKPVRIPKLRTMVPHAEFVLETLLRTNAQARSEWNRFCKLKHDPRIIKGIGKLLRKTSLDELPQLWNILKGEMSLVGPRPFPRYHNQHFEQDFRSLRTQVTPGLTGLWQVSARSNGDFTVQASLDSYYIRNWSVWLDIYILVRTVRAVLAREGAY